MKVKRQLFPDRDPDEMVLVGKTVTYYPPDPVVCQYLYNRLAGRPAEDKTDPLDESGEEKPTASREEIFMDFMELLFSRFEERSQQAQPQNAPTLTVIDGGQ